jgi:hypothetical protein
VTVKNISNLAASVQARLQNHARTSKRPFQELLQYYAMERFLYRLSTTSHRACFVLKGALMLHVWDTPLARATDFTEQASTLAQWTAFRKKLPNAECPSTLAEVVPLLAEFLLPIARASERGERFVGRWTAGGPWTRGL